LALRPMTEMEFEKAARGSSVGGANARTYPWGDADVGTDTYTYNDGSGNATYRKYYAVFNNQPARPADVGHYLRGDIARTNEQTGASSYGVTDLAGNDWEHLINCAWTQVPANGAGSLSVPASWPGASAGKGLRGGSWDYAASGLRVSDRSGAGYTNATRYGTVGFRPARTAD
ncbi:MAG: SUMF1/EgtB/PvdO family nonheme iron enzyme, partial [Candidatus Peribacteraceae bacterium]|nr:SUMF1/EgtB/PvdO family nonheme iron enzyme [Candidatus Peribacteraceae bacterium]